MVNSSRKNYFLISLLFIFALFSFKAQGQIIRESLFTDNYVLEPEKEGVWEVCIDNTGFVKNNENDSHIQKGYTLPGFRLSPRLIYTFSSKAKLEAGLSLLRYWGADKYPNYAYRDIAEWKADGYQLGFHILPFFRAQVQPIPQLNIVLGSLYGGSNHRLIEPLYHPELNLSADPESGAQILYDSKRIHLDAWVNWESFTFKNDTHNEAFSAGISACFRLTNPLSSFYLDVPIQALAAHRGGEIDVVQGSILSLMNGAAGLRSGFNFNGNLLKNIEIDVFGLGYSSSASGIYSVPFARGSAFYSSLTVQIRDLQFKMAYWRSNKFIGIFGNPFFGNVSTSSLGNRTFPQMTIFNPSVQYERKVGGGIYLGADFDYYFNPELVADEDYSKQIRIGRSNSYSFGLYLRLNPSIVLKKN